MGSKVAVLGHMSDPEMEAQAKTPQHGEGKARREIVKRQGAAPNE